MAEIFNRLLMNSFELSLENDRPENMVVFTVNLQSLPPKISCKTLNTEKYIPVNNLVKHISIRDVIFDEGFLNILSCRCDTGKCNIYFFGNLKGLELISQLEYKIDTLRDFDLLNEKINFILSKSKNILKSYYRDAKIKNIEHHILAFLSDRPAAE